ncbi:MAG: hypothetical protein R3E89_18495 [Thiolinea sp.]
MAGACCWRWIPGPWMPHGASTVTVVSLLLNATGQCPALYGTDAYGAEVDSMVKIVREALAA